MSTSVPLIEHAKVSAYRVPTETPESDGTLEWKETILVLVEVVAGGTSGLGYTYADTATGLLLKDKLLPQLVGRDPTAIEAISAELSNQLRNLGQSGVSAMAISALNIALWDLKSKLLGVSVAKLIGRARDCIQVYASGGFTSYSLQELREQVSSWTEQEFDLVKIKIGRCPEKDTERIDAAKRSMTKSMSLFVDANGAYGRAQASETANHLVNHSVKWFEEPVHSTDLEGLNILRTQGYPGLAISAGEYGFEPHYFRRMLEAQAVDVIQADATRCAGISGFLKVAALCEAFDTPLSSHCAPTLHMHLCCSTRPACHLEYFYDHARIEKRLFDGVPEVERGFLSPDWDRPGLGIEFKYSDASEYRI